MIRPIHQHLRRVCCRILSWRKRRELMRRPGHFPIPQPAWLPELPWRQLLAPRSLACAVLVGTFGFGWMMMNPEPVGADATQIERIVQSNRPAPPPLPESGSIHLEGKVAMLLQVAMLQEAMARLDAVDNYSATFDKQERIEGTLSDFQTIALKIRHEPFSVYFKYEKGGDVGREVLYPISDDDPRMMVHLTKFGGRLPPVKLEPTSPLAMNEARYPVTMAGLKELTDMALEIRRRDLSADDIRTTMRDDRTFDGRPVYEFVIDYPNARYSKDYRKSILMIDKQMMLPVCVRNYTWAENLAGVSDNVDDETTLLEHYAFRGIRLDANLQPVDFASENPNYQFH